MIRVICALALLSLPMALAGCGRAIVPVLAGIASGTTIAKDVFDIDVSIHQRTPGKTPVNRVVPLP